MIFLTLSRERGRSERGSSLFLVQGLEFKFLQFESTHSVSHHINNLVKIFFNISSTFPAQKLETLNSELQTIPQCVNDY